MNKSSTTSLLLTAASFAGIQSPTEPVRIRGARPCPKCGGKAIWHDNPPFACENARLLTAPDFGCVLWEVKER